MSSEHEQQPGTQRSPAALTQHIATIQRGQWTALLLDPSWRILWVSPELQGFLGETDPERLGYGLPAPQAWLQPAWTRTIDAESMGRLVAEVGPFLLGDIADQGRIHRARRRSSWPRTLAATPPLHELAPDDSKVVRDAGNLAVTQV